MSSHVYATLTHHDELHTGSPITGVHFDVHHDGIEFEISVLDMPPIPDRENAIAGFARLLGSLSEVLDKIAKNPTQMLWNGNSKELMPTGVHFRGQGPFLIEPPQSASAQALSSTVEMTLDAIVGNAPQPRPIRIQMTRQVANKLGHDLVQAAVEVETRGA